MIDGPTGLRKSWDHTARETARAVRYCLESLARLARRATAFCHVRVPPHGSLFVPSLAAQAQGRTTGGEDRTNGDCAR